MRLTKVQSRILASGVFVFVFLIGALLTKSKKELGTVPTIEFSKDANGELDAKVVFGEFRKSEIKDGKKLWEIHARTGRYSPEKNIADLEETEVTIYKERDTIKLTTDRARVTMSGTTLTAVDAEGNVVAHSQERDVTLKTPRAIYNKEADTLSCPDHVEIIAPQGTVSGDGLDGTIDVKKFTLKRNVRTYIKAEEDKDGTKIQKKSVKK